MNPNSDQTIKLFYICCLFRAVNKACRLLRGITYTVGDRGNDDVLPPFKVFLCKLALICDFRKGGDTVTALAVLKNANGPQYIFASNLLKSTGLSRTKDFLTEILDLVGKNPDRIAEKALARRVLSRILDFHQNKVKYYVKEMKNSIRECIDQVRPILGNEESEASKELRRIQASARISWDISSGNNATHLSDLETLIKAIQAARASDLNRVINERADAEEGDQSKAWCELRHYFGRLLSYRQASECFVKASKEWPELFTGFTVQCIPSKRSASINAPQSALSLPAVIDAAFPDGGLAGYSENINELCEHHLNRNIQEEIRCGSIRKPIHCEVNLRDFLVRDQKTTAAEYWNDSMFIATSKPPCRLCHYFFSDLDNDFDVQSSHMNVYSHWCLPDITEEHGEDTRTQQTALLEEITSQMQQDTLRLVEEMIPQWRRNDSRTESHGLSTAIMHDSGGRNDTRNSYSFFSASETSERGGLTDRQYSGPVMDSDDSDFLHIGAAISE